MAKIWKDDVLILDSASQGIDQQVTVYSITVHAGADTWVVALSDKDATLKFSSASDIANDRGTHFTFPKGLKMNGVVATTMTDVTRVILTTKTDQW